MLSIKNRYDTLILFLKNHVHTKKKLQRQLCNAYLFLKICDN